jgi:hypothetical protein
MATISRTHAIPRDSNMMLSPATPVRHSRLYRCRGLPGTGPTSVKVEKFERLRKKCTHRPGTPLLSAEAKSTFNARRNLRAGMPARCSKMICTQLQIMEKAPDHSRRRCLTAWRTEGGEAVSSRDSSDDPPECRRKGCARFR